MWQDVVVMWSGTNPEVSGSTYPANETLIFWEWARNGGTCVRTERGAMAWGGVGWGGVVTLYHIVSQITLSIHLHVSPFSLELHNSCKSERFWGSRANTQLLRIGGFILGRWSSALFALLVCSHSLIHALLYTVDIPHLGSSLSLFLFLCRLLSLFFF